jgi:hypothetical protein
MKAWHVVTTLKRQQRDKWLPLLNLARANDIDMITSRQGSKLSFQRLLVQQFRSQTDMIEHIMGELNFKLTEVEKLELQESCNDFQTDTPVCYRCFTSENIMPSSNDQQGFVLCHKCASQANDYAQFLCKFPVKNEGIYDVIMAVRDSVVQEGVFMTDDAAAKHRSKWRQARIKNLETRLERNMSKQQRENLFSLEYFVKSVRSKVYAFRVQNIKNAFIVTLIVGLFFPSSYVYKTHI